MESVLKREFSRDIAQAALRETFQAIGKQLEPRYKGRNVALVTWRSVDDVAEYQWPHWYLSERTKFFGLPLPLIFGAPLPYTDKSVVRVDESKLIKGHCGKEGPGTHVLEARLFDASVKDVVTWHLMKLANSYDVPLELTVEE